MKSRKTDHQGSISRSISRLITLVSQKPDKAKDAAHRLRKKIDGKIETANGEKRMRVKRSVFRLNLAKKAILQGNLGVPEEMNTFLDPDLGQWENDLGWLGIYQSERGNLGETSAVDAYVWARCFRWGGVSGVQQPEESNQEFEQRQEAEREDCKRRLNAQSVEEFRTEQFAGLDAESVVDRTAVPAFMLSQLLAGEAEHPNKSGSAPKLWETAIVLLVACAIEVPMESIGFETELPCGFDGNGEEAGLFEYRDGIIAYSRIGEDSLNSLSLSVVERLEAILKFGLNESGEGDTGGTLGIAEAESSETARITKYCFQKRGNVWFVMFGEKEAYVRDLIGMGMIAKLLKTPGEGVSVEALGLGLEGTRASHSEKMTDQESIDSYRTGIRQKRANLEDAEAMLLEGGGRASRDNLEEGIVTLKKEIHDLEGYLSSVTNNKGKPRPIGDSEKLRKSAGRNLDTAMEMLSSAAPDLGVHLRESIKTPRGSSPRYEPGNRRPSWEL